MPAPTTSRKWLDDLLAKANVKARQDPSFKSSLINRIVDVYFDLSSMDGCVDEQALAERDRLCQQFLGWWFNGQDEEEKDKAMRRKMDEIFDATPHDQTEIITVNIEELVT